MVSVAKSFDAPIKLLFPQTSWEAQPSMLGLGDIVIPGIFLALLLRMDYFIHKNKLNPKHIRPHAHIHLPPPTVDMINEKIHPSTNSPPLSPHPPTTPYFTITLISYFIGLSFTVGIMYYFNAAQPALLYLVPACVGGSMSVAIAK